MQNHVWIVEQKFDGQWSPLYVSATRSGARAYQERHFREGESRIRKFIAA